MNESASIRVHIAGSVLETMSGVGHLLEALPARTRYTRQELLHEAEKLGWKLEAELPVEGTDSEVLLLFGQDI